MKKNYDRIHLDNMEAPIPEGCDSIVSDLLGKEPKVVWNIVLAVLKRMPRHNTEKIRAIILDMLKNFPKEMAEWRQEEIKMKKFFDKVLNEPFGVIFPDLSDE